MTRIDCRRNLSFIILVLLVLAARAALSAAVGIYAPGEGGKVSGAQAIKSTLADAKIPVADMPRMSMENLLQYRVVIIPNTRTLATNEDSRWRDNLRAYVAGCGGALVFCHDAVGAARSPFGQAPLFPELVVPGSVARAAARQVKVAVNPLADFDYLPGYDIGQTAEHMYDDHFVFLQNGGTALLTDAAGEKTVLAVGAVGKGRVVFNGMFGGKPPLGHAERLEGIDRDALVNAVQWCLAGRGLVVTNAAAIKVAEWRAPAGAVTARHKVALLGNNDRMIREYALGCLKSTGIEYDFIPFPQAESLDLLAAGYKLAMVMFAPYAGDSDAPEAVFQQINRYIDGDGKVMVFLPAVTQERRPRAATYFLKPLGVSWMPVRRDNQDLLRSVQWQDASGDAWEIHGNYIGGGGWFQPFSEPATDAAKTIGHWIDHRGAQKYPAIIQTAYGYIVNLNIHHDHALFTAAAAVKLLPEIGPAVFTNLLQRYAGSEALLASNALTAAGADWRAQAGKSRLAAAAAAEVSEYERAVRLMVQAGDALEKAYAADMPSPAGEARLVFVNPREMVVQPDMDVLFDRVARAGFNGLAMSADGYYPSALYPERVADDKLSDWIKAARRHGLQFGVVIDTFSIAQGAALFERMRTENWRVVPADACGKPLPPFPAQPGSAGICRSHPEVVEFAVAKAREIIEKYPVDCLLFDCIRWGAVCYCDYCKTQFQADTGLKIENWPAEAMVKYQNEYNDWRARPVTRVVRETAANIAQMKPAIKLGIFGRQGRRTSWGNAQYWWEWGNDVDFIIPMIYMSDNRKVEELLREIGGLIPAGAKARLLPVLAAPGDQRGGANLLHLRQIDLQRQYAPAGIMYFSYSTLHDDYLELLRMGPFHTAASCLRLTRDLPATWQAGASPHPW